jgi:hypothetical protein
MIRKIERTYVWSHREVAEALIQQLRAKDIPAPQYVADTNNTKWEFGASGVTVEWADEDTPDLQ